jgi:cytochrome c biogenesis protein CcdA
MDWIRIVAGIVSIVWGGIHLVDGFKNKRFRGNPRPGPLKLIMGPGPYYEKALNFIVGVTLFVAGVALLLPLFS